MRAVKGRGFNLLGLIRSGSHTAPTYDFRFREFGVKRGATNLPWSVGNHVLGGILDARKGNAQYGVTGGNYA